jgi:beta-galactosidase
MTDEDVRRHLRRIKELGFTCLKGIMLCPGRDLRAFLHMALDEGLIPWWYDEGGWEAMTDDLLARLGIPADTPPEKVRSDPRMLAHQEKVLRARADAEAGARGRRKAQRRKGLDLESGRNMTLAAASVPAFVAWLRQTYGTLDRLADAWNFGHAGLPRPARAWASWRDVEADLPEAIGTRDYRRLRDVIRFKADTFNAGIRGRAERARREDPHAPFRAGGEMGLFLPFAARATDMEGIADVMAEHGSFYPSIHLCWHFEEVDFEIARPVYMQASLVQDWFKGGWSAAWESTGGPQQLSGAKGMAPGAAGRTAGFTVDGGVMTQLMLSYLAAGFKGFGFWCWSARTAGVEVGEYALTDRELEPTGRAVEAGRIGRAARRLRDELWLARKEPLVGLYQDFENDAAWAAMSVHNRDKFKYVPMQARVGAARALINANVPWEHVTGADLRAGLAGRYRVIYLPAVIGLESDLLDILSKYVEGGGRLVLDMPGALLDEFGRLLATGPGTRFERTFGATIRDLQYSSNVRRALGGRRLEGFVVDLALTGAAAVAAYEAGGPAVTEHRFGKGTAVILGYEASLLCFRPGDAEAEARLVRWALGPHESPYACRGAIAYRLAAPAADHYFLINDGPAAEATLQTRAYRYARAADAVSGETLALGRPIALAAYSGRWVRCEKGSR